MASRKPKIADTTAIVTVRRAVSDDPPALDGGAVYPGGRAVSLSIVRGAIVATVERAESRPLAVTFTPEELISAALDAEQRHHDATRGAYVLESADVSLCTALRAAATAEGVIPNNQREAAAVSILLARGFVARHRARAMGGGTRIVCRITKAGRAALATLDAEQAASAPEAP